MGGVGLITAGVCAMASVRIERAANGYEVCVTDPEIVAANRKAKTEGPWRDPEREYVFKTLKEVLDFLDKNLDKALPADEFDSSFAAALAESEEED